MILSVVWVNGSWENVIVLLVNYKNMNSGMEYLWVNMLGCCDEVEMEWKSYVMLLVGLMIELLLRI